MPKIIFASLMPHAPILLPQTGSVSDHEKLKKTLSGLKILRNKIKKNKIDEIIISSPHPDWGFDVPLFFLNPDSQIKITKILTGFEPPKEYFFAGEKYAKKLVENRNYALVASGDLSHCLLKEGPYGFNPQGPKFDQALIKNLKNKKIEKIIHLEELFPEAGNCGLRPLVFILGLLKGNNSKIKPKILSYEGPFGVGYAVATLI